MKYIFTDIDGVLNPKFSKNWDKKCVSIYNRICTDFDLKPIISSTWRIRYSIPELQELFIKQGITAKIYDYTPVLNDFRGLEIDQWLIENNWDEYVVIDDRIKNIVPYVNNVVGCKGWIGLTEDHYNEIKKLINKKGD